MRFSSQLTPLLLPLLPTPLLALHLLPQCPPPPSNSNTHSSILLLWTISDFSTDFSLPDGGSVIFRLSNTLTGYAALCFRRGRFPEGQCIWAEGGVGEEDDTETGFSFSYIAPGAVEVEDVVVGRVRERDGSGKEGELRVWQRWSCDGDG